MAKTTDRSTSFGPKYKQMKSVCFVFSQKVIWMHCFTSQWDIGCPLSIRLSIELSAKPFSSVDVQRKQQMNEFVHIKLNNHFTFTPIAVEVLL